MKRRAQSLAVVALLLGGPGFTFAVEHSLPTKVFLLRNPTTGDPTKRKATFAEEEQVSPIAIVGDPTLSGATLLISLADGAQQCFDLPASAWFAVGTVGFKYRNRAGSGAVTSGSIIKERFSGDLILKFQLRGSKGPLDLGAGARQLRVHLDLPDQWRRQVLCWRVNPARWQREHLRLSSEEPSASGILPSGDVPVTGAVGTSDTF